MRMRGAFTFIEVLIVVVILGILAMIVVPQFSEATTDARLNSLQTTLQVVRAQLQVYRMQHGDALPTSPATFEAQMTLASKPDGTTAPPGTTGFVLGPYLQAIPDNPYTRSNTVGSGAVGTSDWFYDGSSGQFRANHDAAFTGY